MKIILIFVLFFASININLAQENSAQNYSFIQLIEMTNDRKTFEINMIKGLNQMNEMKAPQIIAF